jgi:ABC-type multidrug transport system ATPase subunit
VALLDDIFSALDATTAFAVFESLRGKNGSGALRDSATILVTHALHFLPRVDQILILSDGSPSFYGTWSELQALKAEDGSVIDVIRSSKQEFKDKSSLTKHGRLHGEGLEEKDGIIMAVEEREYGSASFWVWILWFHNAGGWSFTLLQILFFSLERCFYVMSDWYVSVNMLCTLLNVIWS